MIKVAVIGPPHLVDLIMKEGPSFDSLMLIPYKYESPEDTSSIVKDCKEEVDVLVLSGPIAYENVIDEVGSCKIVCLSHNGSGLYQVFFQLLIDDKYQLNNLRFSIDISREKEIEEKLEEVGIVYEKMFVKEYNVGNKLKEFTEFHYDLWLNNEIDVAFTCVSSVYNDLVRLKVPCYLFTPTKSAINECLYRAELEGKSKMASYYQIAIIKLSLDNLLKNNQATDYRIQRLKLDVQQILIDFCEETQALSNWTDQNEITLTATRGALIETTNNFTHVKLIDKICELDLSLSVGIGFGRTATEAEIKAKEALLKAKMDRNNSCYIIEQDSNVIGPMGEGIQLRYLTRSNDPKLLELSEQVGLSVGTINKIISFCNKYGYSNLTAHDVANGFGISIRSARRMINKLELCGLVHVSGVEQPVGKGRPRQIYNFNINLS